MGTDATPLVNEELLFDGIDCIYESLFANSGDELLDTLTVEALEMILGQFCLVLVRQLSDYLDGGTVTQNVQTLQKETSFAPKRKERANATTLNLESSVMYRHNQTGNG